jgi:multiple sugar transport system substrate-binding protein
MTRRLLAAMAVGALTLSACGRDGDSDSDGAREGDAVSEGKASGDVTVWAMGTEGEKLSVLADAFMKENPDAHVTLSHVLHELGGRRGDHDRRRPGFLQCGSA